MILYLEIQTGLPLSPQIRISQWPLNLWPELAFKNIVRAKFYCEASNHVFEASYLI